MSKKVPEPYKSIVEYACRDTLDIRYPNCAGTKHNLFIASTTDGPMVVKFGTKDMVLKNLRARMIYQRHGIPVPDSRAVQCGDHWMEVYPMIAGKTLWEHMQNGARPEFIRRAYADILVNIAKMDRIPVSPTDTRVATTIYDHHKQTHPAAVAYAMKIGVAAANIGAKNLGLYHADISPRNVVVRDDGYLKSFIDLDSVSVCNRNFAISVMATRWKNMGYDLNELFDMVNNITGRPANQAYVRIMAAVNRFASRGILRHLKHPHVK